MTNPLVKPTMEELFAELMATIEAEFGVVNEDEFGVFRTYLELAAQTGADARSFTIDLVQQAYPQTATGWWLDEHAKSVGMARIAERRAEGLVRLTVTQGVTIPRGAILQTVADNAGRTLRYTVTQDTAIAGPSGVVPVIAERPGTAHNVSAGRIRTLVTVVPGVSSVTNDADWLTLAGVDRETDAQLQRRILLRWPSQSNGGIRKNYEFAALSVPGILKVMVNDDHPRGQGTVDVVVAPQRGAPTAEQIAAVQAAIMPVRAVTANALALAPVLVPQDITLTVYRVPTNTDPLDVWEDKVRGVFDALGIGATYYPTAVSDALRRLEDPDTGTFTPNPDVIGVVIDTPLTPVDPGDGGLVTAGTIAVTLA